ncbi:hypothetical protein B7P43_G00588, partial [Cryptotermes secundus]
IGRGGAITWPPRSSDLTGIPKFLTKFNAVSLLQAFCHLERNENATNTSTDASGSVASQQKMTHAHESPFYHYPQFPTPLAITYRGKK